MSRCIFHLFSCAQCISRDEFPPHRRRKDCCLHQVLRNCLKCLAVDLIKIISAYGTELPNMDALTAPIPQTLGAMRCKIVSGFHEGDRVFALRTDFIVERNKMFGKATRINVSETHLARSLYQTSEQHATVSDQHKCALAHALHKIDEGKELPLMVARKCRRLSSHQYEFAQNPHQPSFARMTAQIFSDVYVVERGILHQERLITQMIRLSRFTATEKSALKVAMTAVQIPITSSIRVSVGQFSKLYRNSYVQEFPKELSVISPTSFFAGDVEDIEPASPIAYANYHNESPHWVVYRDDYQLTFDQRRVKLSSKKNVKLFCDDSTITAHCVFQLGAVAEPGEFICDIAYPLSIVEGFTMAVAILDSNIDSAKVGS